ncbi:hypothetical protein CGCF415_v015707 [Colletotrichum fructicola]|uniref:Uncharacterized protein n=1 Tax=Colletotrichum fructicola (strain Nara gc5) TaxID=1213859 RepID=A0A7J6IS51_COLFN|nr:uncharacterized protein CGMCC3_g3310 [Colletotrichum fructicola]KAF4479157.1 hypothetical protein CGGC5_v012674 [Colletotrichum fructicola Nara gc5]KAE9580595.1 hypothetical protein CGMCC3_g3310 [Colletotrichum fructicola]KAF4422987.1 hypothetical protein CFRS1_v001223 [Colletotrichum fructicola]KAF4881638.1 hypothetical protein CGCFRS4_v015358 [Colletotrichum fructicola]KAF4883876.1 hypothetical protein CGCF415_v015707 [Colletotrichum fructicola]
MALKPRLDPYTRLTSRFYEALLLLSTLRPVNGPHIITKLDTGILQGARRRFLRNLCVLCDYQKGGDSTTSIGAEDRDDTYVLWVSSNEGPTDNVIDFIITVLEGLRRVVFGGEEQNVVAEDLLLRTTRFVIPRLRKERSILRRTSRSCAEIVEGVDPQPNNGLILWLGQCQSTNLDDLAVCRLAYEHRHDHEMDLMVQYGQEEEESGSQLPMARPFSYFRHTIGRLAHRVRVVSELFQDARRLPALLQDSHVERVQPPMSATVPMADGHTTLQGILRRLLPARDQRYGPYLDFLKFIDQHVNNEAGIIGRLEDSTFTPCVHAEVQMLHHFDKGNRNFVANDKYIACSKPACICCELYFRHHPMRVTLIDAHQKAYPKWGLIGLTQGAQSADWISQRNILIDVIQDLKPIVLDQISQLQVSSLHHPDSVSQITESLADDGDLAELSDVDSEQTFDTEPESIADTAGVLSNEAGTAANFTTFHPADIAAFESIFLDNDDDAGFDSDDGVKL